MTRKPFGQTLTPPVKPPTPRKPAQRNRGALHAHLPRVELIVDIEDKACPCCREPLHPIGEDVAEMLDYVPAQLRVKVIRRPRYGCRACEGAVMQAPAPERPIDGRLATEVLLAHVLISKYSDHLPLYRQSQILARQGITLDRSTLCNWVGRACWWLAPLHEGCDSKLCGLTSVRIEPPGGRDDGSRHRRRSIGCLPAGAPCHSDPCCIDGTRGGER